MKTSTALTGLIFFLEVLGILLFVLCGYTIFSILSTVNPSGGGQIPISIDTKTQTATLTYTSKPTNSGFLPANLNIGFGLNLGDESYSAKNVTTVYMGQGKQSEVSLTLKVPLAKLEEYVGGKGTLEIYTSVNTLYGLVKIDYNALTKGGQ
jgi:hypothetical protein